MRLIKNFILNIKESIRDEEKTEEDVPQYINVSNKGGICPSCSTYNKRIQGTKYAICKGCKCLRRWK